MRDNAAHENFSISPNEMQNGVQAIGNDHQSWRFDAHGDNVGVGRSMLHPKGILDVSSMVNESGNDQHREYDVDKSGEGNEHWVGVRELEYERHLFD